MSLGLLVGRFGNFVRETHVPPIESEPLPPFPDGLNHLREAVGHHLIPLVLIARADGEFERRERDVIVTHCMTFARSRGLEIDGSGTVELVEYIESYRPSLMQLDPALTRLERGSHDEMAALIAAARAVVEADGVIRPEETRLLDELKAELGRLGAAA
jgi:tellurite resistance protein